MDEYRQRVSEGVEQPAQHNLRLINEVEPPELQEVEVPKVLGDVFEALIGDYFYSRGHWHLFSRKPRWKSRKLKRLEQIVRRKKEFILPQEKIAEDPWNGCCPPCPGRGGGGDFRQNKSWRGRKGGGGTATLVEQRDRYKFSSRGQCVPRIRQSQVRIRMLPFSHKSVERTEIRLIFIA